MTSSGGWTTSSELRTVRKRNPNNQIFQLNQSDYSTSDDSDSGKQTAASNAKFAQAKNKKAPRMLKQKTIQNKKAGQGKVLFQMTDNDTSSSSKTQNKQKNDKKFLFEIADDSDDSWTSTAGDDDNAGNNKKVSATSAWTQNKQKNEALLLQMADDNDDSWTSTTGDDGADKKNGIDLSGSNINDNQTVNKRISLKQASVDHLMRKMTELFSKSALSKPSYAQQSNKHGSPSVLSDDSDDEDAENDKKVSTSMRSKQVKKRTALLEITDDSGDSWTSSESGSKAQSKKVSKMTQNKHDNTLMEFSDSSGWSSDEEESNKDNNNANKRFGSLQTMKTASTWDGQSSLNRSSQPKFSKKVSSMRKSTQMSSSLHQGTVRNTAERSTAHGTEMTLDELLKENDIELSDEIKISHIPRKQTGASKKKTQFAASSTSKGSLGKAKSKSVRVSQSQKPWQQSKTAKQQEMGKYVKKQNKLQVNANHFDKLQPKKEWNFTQSGKSKKMDSKQRAMIDDELKRTHEQTMRALNAKYDKMANKRAQMRDWSNSKRYDNHERFKAMKGEKSDMRAKEWAHIVQMEAEQNKLITKLNEHNAYVSERKDQISQDEANKIRKSYAEQIEEVQNKKHQMMNTMNNWNKVWNGKELPKVAPLRQRKKPRGQMQGLGLGLGYGIQISGVKQMTVYNVKSKRKSNLGNGEMRQQGMSDMSGNMKDEYFADLDRISGKDDDEALPEKQSEYFTKIMKKIEKVKQQNCALQKKCLAFQNEHSEQLGEQKSESDSSSEAKYQAMVQDQEFLKYLANKYL